MYTLFYQPKQDSKNKCFVNQNDITLSIQNK